MSFGILGLVGVQLTLHTNADIAKQRAQAVRIAQAAIEEWRGFTTLTLPLPTGHTRSFADIADVATTNVPAAATGIANTTYTITRTVQDTAAPLGKTVRVQVTWNDRSGAAQEVALSTHIAGILPDLSGAVSLPVLNPATREVRGRHFSIPLSAVNQGDGTSHFTPPGAAAGIAWVFSNTTGLITSLCNPFPGSCTAINATLVTGYLRFALGGSAPLVAPTGDDAEFPTDLPPTSLLGTLGVEVQTVGPNATLRLLGVHVSDQPLPDLPLCCAVAVATGHLVDRHRVSDRLATGDQHCFRQCQHRLPRVQVHTGDQRQHNRSKHRPSLPVPQRPNLAEQPELPADSSRQRLGGLRMPWRRHVAAGQRQHAATPTECLTWTCALAKGALAWTACACSVRWHWQLLLLASRTPIRGSAA